MTWKITKKLIATSLNVNQKIIDYIAVLDILKNCVYGYSNKSISKRTQVPIEYVENVLIDFMSFTGWEEDLDISPIAIFRSSGKLFDAFVMNINNLSSMSGDSLIIMAYNTCVVYDYIKEKVEEFYERES